MSQDWLTYIQTSNYGWAENDSLPRPNEDLETQLTSTQSKIKLANGADGFVTPEVKSVKEPISFYFANTSSSLRTQIENYMANGDKIKIITHTNEIFIGRFTTMKRMWFIGISPDEYDIQCTFERTE